MLSQSCSTIYESPTDKQSEGECSPWFSFPNHLGSFENLSQMATAWIQKNSPFNGDLTYEAFFESVARSLHRQQPRHLIIRRERGVGDQAVLAELARRSVGGLYPHLVDVQFVRVDCRFVPPEDSREFLRAIFAKVADFNIVLCLDGLGAILRSVGSTHSRSVLFSLLAQTSCRVIGTVSPQEFEEHLAGRQDTDEFFSHVELLEPTPQAAQKLVEHFAIGLAQQYSIDIEQDAIRSAIVLADNYIPSSRLPSKAVGLLRDVCDDLAFERSQGISQRETVTVDDVIKRVSEISGVPAATLAGLPDGVDYCDVIGSRIVGQDHVVQEVATELSLIRAGMIDAGKPASVMLFVGQTGTGKTELAKVMAQLYSASKRLKTFTLGNYSEPHSVSGIIGVPAGYVGHDQGGRLVNELNADPYSVFLLDEADKAHPDVMQPFLNLFDEGWVLDQRGVKGFAERAIFILTTNVGQRQIAEMQKKGKSWDEIHTKLMESLSQIRHAKANRPVFSAEFLARIKRVVIFKPLDAEAMAGITRQLCSDLIEKWNRERDKELVVDSGVIKLIAEQAEEQNQKSKGKEGGRIVRKLIANLIEARLQAAIAKDPEVYRRSPQARVSLDSTDGAMPVVVSFREGANLGE